MNLLKTCPTCGKDVYISQNDWACSDINCKYGHGNKKYMEEKILTGKQLKEMIFESTEDKRDIVITLPSTIKWEDYRKELDSVHDYTQEMNFKVSNFPTKTEVGKKCYLCYKGNIVGWMEIVGFEEKEFDCSTTGQAWKGKFIQRSGPFHYITNIPMKGFQGFRYINNYI